MKDELNNYGKTIISIYDALLSAGIDAEATLGCLEAPDALFIYRDADENADDRMYQLAADTMTSEQLKLFKAELEKAIAEYDEHRNGDGLVEDFIEASLMMGSTPDEMTADVAKIMEALKNGEELKIPRMEDTWYADGAHGS